MYKVEIPNLQELRDSFAKAPQKVAPILIDATKQAGAVIVNEEKKQVPVKTGTLRRSVELSLGNIYARITPTANYASYVNFGTGIHNGGGYIYPKKSKYLKFNVGGRTIYCKRIAGQRANPFAERTLLNAKQQIIDIFNKAGNKIVNEL